MAEKHKSKYKRPENTKYKSRTDLKDYTEDDKKGGLNPKSAGEKQSNVLCKTDKEFVDTGDMYVKYNADDRLYKDLEDGEYDPKHAAKVLKKRQDNDEKDNAKNIKDKIENLTREQKEVLVREYVRRKINILLEQPTPTEDPTAEDPTATPDATAPAPEETAPAPDDATATPEAPADTAAPEAPAPETSATEQPAAEISTLDKFASELKQEGNLVKFRLIGKLFNNLFDEKTDPKTIESFYRMLRSLAIKKLGQLNAAVATSDIKNTDTKTNKE